MKKIIVFVYLCLIIGCEKSKSTSSTPTPTPTPCTSCTCVCSSVQCSSLTQQNIRCKNMTTNCCGRCYLHK